MRLKSSLSASPYCLFRCLSQEHGDGHEYINRGLMGS